MGAKLFFLTGLLGFGGYFGYKVTSYDPAVVPYSKAEVQEMLASARTTMPRRDGDGNINIWGTGKTSDGVGLAMKYAEADWAPLITCRAVITELGPKESRVVADCGSPSGKSAMADTTLAMRAPMFDEHIQSKLQHREFDRKRADSKEVGIAMRNMGGMQKEALKTADQMSRMSSSNPPADNLSGSSSSQPAGGWGDGTSSSPSN